MRNPNEKNTGYYCFISGGDLAKIEKEWRKGDRVELLLPMHITTKRWVENSVSVERGPLVYALKIEEDWKYENNKDSHGSYFEVKPTTPWNYALVADALKDMDKGFVVVKNSAKALYPWNLKNAPIMLKTKGKQVAERKLYNNVPGPLPHSRPSSNLKAVMPVDIKLVPYGCSTLRISEFPVVE